MKGAVIVIGSIAFMVGLSIETPIQPILQMIYGLVTIATLVLFVVAAWIGVRGRRVWDDQYERPGKVVEEEDPPWYAAEVASRGRQAKGLR